MKLALSSLLAPAIALSLLPLAACALDTDDAGLEDTEQAESEVSRPCSLGGTCAPTQRLLTSRLFTSDKRAPARKRADVTVEAPSAEHESVPRIFAQKTSRHYTFAGGKRVLLSGSADGAAPIEVDDFLLVEILEVDGSLLAAGQLGYTSPITVGATRATMLGAAQNQRVEPVDIAPLLPTDRPFLVRVSALDFLRRAYVSEVHLVVTDAPPPPPPPTQVDLFDDAAFGGAPLTRAEAVALFAPGAARADLGAFVFAQRSRTCNQVTGCGAWDARPSVSLSGESNPGTGGWYENPRTSAVPSGTVTGKTWLAVDAGKILLGLKSDQQVLTADKCGIDGAGWCSLQTSTTSCYWRADRTRNCYSYPSDVRSDVGTALALQFRVDAQHVRGKSATLKGKADGAGTYRESEYVMYARTDGAPVTLVEEGDRVFARF